MPNPFETFIGKRKKEFVDWRNWRNYDVKASEVRNKSTPDEFLLWELDQTTSMNEVGAILAERVKQKEITPDQAGELENQYILKYSGFISLPREWQAYLSGFTSSNDLADRLNQMGLPAEAATPIYSALIQTGDSVSQALRASASRQQQDQLQAETKLSAGRDYMPGPGVTPAWSGERDITSPELIAQEDLNQANLLRTQDWLKQEAVTNPFSQRNMSLDRLKRQREGQTADALMNLVNQPLMGTPAPPKAIPNMPDYAGIYEPFLKKFEGNPNFQNYIRSQLSDIAQKTRQSRQDWWVGQNTPARAVPTYGGELDRLNAEANRWGAVAEAAPSSAYAGNTYYGEGGLQAIAAGGRDLASGRLADLQALGEAGYAAQEGAPEDPAPKREDPFAAYLHNFPFLKNYMQQSPEQRGFNPRLTAPRTIWKIPK